MHVKKSQEEVRRELGFGLIPETSGTDPATEEDYRTESKGPGETSWEKQQKAKQKSP